MAAVTAPVPPPILSPGLATATTLSPCAGVMTALHGEHVVTVPLADIAGKVKMVPAELLRAVRVLA